MQLALLDLLQREEAIDEVDGDVERLGPQAELPVHVDDPLDEEGARRVLHLCRLLHLFQVRGGHLDQLLLPAHVLVDLGGVLGGELRVPQVDRVSEDHLPRQLLSISRLPLLELLAHALNLLVRG